ncbi:MAG TPA: amidohydrolase, partial [Thermoanaerobaculia bacterium]|nr:amidohydrolase [Thermoanaerobaculia bacterium]
MSRFKILALLAILAALPAGAETVAITGGRIITMGAAGTIDSGTVLIQDGKIAAVGANVTIPSGARRIDAKGQPVTPGLMDSLSRLGLVEVNAVEGSRDARTEDDRITAAFQVADAINPRSMLIPVNRIEGLTRAVVAPQAGTFLISGQGSIIHLGGPGDFLVRSPVAMFGVLGEEGMGFA